MVRALAVAGALVLIACRDGGDWQRPAGAPAPEPSAAPVAVPTSSPTLQSAELPVPAAEPAEPPPTAPVVRVEEVAVAGDLPALVVRGVGDRHLKMLFLPGMCAHAGVYAESFPQTAASRGDLVVLQGDISCGGDGAARKWSSDLEVMDRRVDAAFRAAGLGEPRNVVVIGYSQGAERGERLVSRWPEKYDRAVLVASPVKPSARNLGRARAVVLMAGTRDGGTGLMQAAVTPLKRAAVATTFVELPGARHGEMGEDPEQTMDAALDFVDVP